MEVKNFVDDWNERGNEKSDTQIFWLTLLRDIFNVDRPEKFLRFERKVEVDGHSCWIDAMIPSTKVLIEQKSFDVDLTKPAMQSDGKFLTPFEQAKRYADELPYSERPRWIITCNFKEFHIYDLELFKNFALRQKAFIMENFRNESSLDDEEDFKPQIIKLEELAKNRERLNFLIDSDDMSIKPEVSISSEAAKIVGKIYDAFDRTNEIDKVSLNKLCVRLVFCLYAEDAGIFGRNQFYDYLKSFKIEERHEALAKLFEMLNQDASNEYNFPYVNGGLFADDKFAIPKFNEDINYQLLTIASQNFNWVGISPTIFGALFESTLNTDTRRSGGMHYTSVENIHKVIDPLFLDELHEEFNKIKRSRVRRGGRAGDEPKNKNQRLRDFQNKLASLKFFDPACGSGNFLTETYLSLRRLENEVLKEMLGVQIKLGELDDPIKVSINQFYGIELNDFAVAVAQTAMWIAESQMLQETEMIIHKDLNFLPLKNYAAIVKGNALQMDWHKVAPAADYIIGNPPFIGYSFQTPVQKADLASATGLSTRKIDYVTAWYFKAAQYIQGSDTRCAFVSTNSITQGEQVAIIWRPLFEEYHIHIDFAHRTFRWLSEAEDMAAVHCVIIGFSCSKKKRPKIIIDGESKTAANNINAYLLDAENIFVESRNKPICAVPKMITGNRPADGQNLIIEAKDYKDFIKREPKAKKFIKQLMGAEEFINRKERYCLWLVDVPPEEYNDLPLVVERIEACRQDRLKGAADRQKLAETPHLFRETNNPNVFIAIPEISSENRKYIPMGFMDKNIIVTNRIKIIPEATLYHFGVLTSSVHMAWTKVVCGRLEERYDYSIKIVYNNFPWPVVKEKQRREIAQTAQEILKARAQYPKRSLAKLYEQHKMPDRLLKAHRANDLAVMSAYNFNESLSDAEIVAALMKMYQKIISG